MGPMCKLAGMIGCDTIHAGMYGGYMDMGYEELKHVMNICLEQNMVPIVPWYDKRTNTWHKRKVW